MMQSAGAWMRANLTTQGYCLTDTERRELAIGLRFSTGLCLSLVVLALVLESPAMVFALSAIGLVEQVADAVVPQAAGAATAALILGGLLVAACTTVTATHLCLPEMFAWWERRTAPEAPVAT
jgi:hypothetical protein